MLSGTTTFEDTREKQTNKGGRVRWPVYTEQERALLQRKFSGDWENLDFLEAFWNPVYDEGDLIQYRRAAKVWKMRLAERKFKEIVKELKVDPQKACALVSGKNLHPYLVQMYLNSEILSKPREGWKWVLECTPKPTNMFPKAVEVPERIQSYQDLIDLLSQFPPVPSELPAIRFFGLSSEWVQQHKLELFGFLLGFFVGDAGKSYNDIGHRKRHYDKTAMTTVMAINGSNIRILTYVQLALQTIGIDSARRNSTTTIRWNSPASNLLTWVIRTCLGLSASERTSRNPIRMEWILSCPRNFIVAFLQGIAESDGSVDRHGYFTSISSIPNSSFLQRALASINTPSRVHPKHRPVQIRINITQAITLPLFNPIITTYRYSSLVSHARRRHLLPPSPFFSRRAA